MFLLQIYAPLDSSEFPTCFHRTLFLFSCRDGRCAGKNGSIRCFRGQLPRENPYYSFEPPNYDDARPEEEKMHSPEIKCSAPLDPIIELKNEGNKLFSEKQFSQAVDVYTAALALATETDAAATPPSQSASTSRTNEAAKAAGSGVSGEGDGGGAVRAEAGKLLGNRAECLLQLGRCADALRDARAAAALDPAAGKHLCRAARALLGLADGGGAAACGAARRAAAADAGAAAAARGLEEAAAARCREEYLLKQMEVVIEDEESDGEDGRGEEEEHVRRLVSEYKAKEAAGGDGGGGDGDEEDMKQLTQSRANVDPAYLKFKLRTEKEPAQCIR
jgi:tetratricopeptide (TPR) repeat protein